MMLIIPINDVPSQALSVNLAGQACKINLYQRSTGLFFDLFVQDKLITGGVICQNLNRLVRDVYKGFVGDLVFTDTQGKSDPFTPGLGTQFLLCYLELADLAGAG